MIARTFIAVALAVIHAASASSQYLPTPNYACDWRPDASGRGFACIPRTPPPPACPPDRYQFGDKCIRHGFIPCAHGQFACPVGQRCTYASCVPNNIADSAVCSDGKRWCDTASDRCVERDGQTSCISQEEWIRDVAQRSQRIREARRSLLEWESQLTLEERLKIDKNNERLLTAEHTWAIADQGAGVLSGLALAKVGFKHGDVYYAGVRGVTDMALRARTPAEVFGELGVSTAADRFSPGAGAAASAAYTQYKYQDQWITFYQTRTR